MEGGLLDSKTINTSGNIERLIEVGDHHIPDLIGVAQGAGGRSQLVGIDGRLGTVSTLASSERYTFLDLVTGRAGGDSKRDTMRLALARDNNTQEAVVLQVEDADKLDEVFRSKAAFSSTRARWAKEGQVFYAFLESPTTPSDIWRLDVSGAHPQNLSILNDPFNDVSFAEPIWLRTSPRGHSEGVLLVPNQWHPGVRCPLIVRPYGNQQTSHLLYRFGVNGSGVENMQLLASRGYAVLVPTLPLARGAPLKSIREHVESLVDAAVSQGIADPNRLGVFGHSFGGYAAIGLATESSPVFRSTVVTGPVGLDLFSYYGFMDKLSASFFIGWTEEGQSNVGANPWSDPSRLLLNSPLFQVDRIHGPVLIVVGETDTPRVPQSNELYVALRRLGSEAEYRIYQREPHWPGSWSSQNAGDYLNRVISWFDTTVGTAPNGTDDAAEHSTNLCR
jgi:dipeptidyl aminopeptidase/acylaminoacyl peptidase